MVIFVWHISTNLHHEERFFCRESTVAIMGVGTVNDCAVRGVELPLRELELGAEWCLN